MRGALARQRGGHWDLTTANAWGVLAVEKFSRAFERGAGGGRDDGVAGRRVAAPVSGRRRRSGGALAFPWPARARRGRGRPRGHGPALGDDRVARRGAARRAAVQRLSHRAEALARRAARAGEPGAGAVAPRRPRPRPARDRGADRHDVGRGGRSGSRPAPRTSAPAWRASRRSSRAGESAPARRWPAFTERGFAAMRAYYEFAPKGTFTVEYTVRLNQAGRFQLPPTRVEALYAPELFGELPNAPLEVAP